MTDPSSLTGLIADLPKTSAKPTILGQYDETTSGRAKVRCAVCHRAVHYKGFLVEVADIGQALLGRNCGKDHFGFDWEKDIQRFEAAVDRQRALVRLQDAAPLADQLLDLAPHMIAGAKRVDGFIGALRRDSGALSQQLVKAVRVHGGGLMITVRERNREAEEESARVRAWGLVDAVEMARDPVERRAARKQLDRWIEDHGKVFSERPERRGVLRGGALLTPSTLAPEALRASVKLRHARDKTREEVDDPAAMIEALRETGQAYTAIIAANGHLDEFTSPANLKTIEQWRVQVPGLYGTIPAVGPWKAEGRTLVQTLWTVVGKA